MPYKDKDPDPREVGRALGVRYVVVGSVETFRPPRAGPKHALQAFAADSGARTSVVANSAGAVISSNSRSSEWAISRCRMPGG